MHDVSLINGEYYPSVTEVLGSVDKPWLSRWREKWGERANQKMRAAANIGTAFHTNAEAMAFKVGSRRVVDMTTQFIRWSITAGLRIKAVEQRVISHYDKYQGTFDAIGYLGKSKTLFMFDWKTSAGIYPEMGLQLTAYARAYEEMTGVKISTGIIVHVSKDKPRHKLTVKRFALTKGRFDEFLAILARYENSDAYKQRSAAAIADGDKCNSPIAKI